MPFVNHLLCEKLNTRKQTYTLTLVYLITVVRPRCELHSTILCVEREVPDVDGARASENEHGEPRDISVMHHQQVGRQRRRVGGDVGAEGRKGRAMRNLLSLVEVQATSGFHSLAQNPEV